MKAKRKFKLIRKIASLAIVCLISVASSVAEGGHKHAKLSPELQSAPPTGNVDVIVQYKTTPSEQHLQKVTAKGAKLKHNLSLIHGAAFKDLPASALAELESDPDVAYIAPDRPLKGSALDYAPESVNAPWAWQQMALDGKGIGVAVIDSGVTPVGDLYWYNPSTGAYGSRVVYSQSFVPGSTDTFDAYGHGTHVAGIIASAGWFSWGSKFSHQFKGIAPNANIINLRALDSTGSGTDSTVIAAIQAAIRLKSQYNIRVINLSLGRPVFESYKVDPLCQATEAAWKAGIVVVAAAGNDGRNNSADTEGYGTIAAPGNDPYVITVGAMKTAGTGDRSDDQVASYSSKGPSSIDHIVKPDLVAPGNKIVSTLSPFSKLQLQDSSTDVWMGEYAYITTTTTTYTSGKGKQATTSTVTNSNFLPTAISQSYFRLSGTSMAAPVVSGAAALMLQADPTLTPDTVKARLMKSASKQFPAFSSTTDSQTGKTYTDYYDAFTVGAGYLDIQAALLSTDVVPSDLNAKSPAAAYDSVANDAYVVADASDVWGNSLVWGTSVVWGDAVFAGATADGESVLWGNSVVWGNQAEEGFSMVWGNSVVWGIADSEAFSVTKGEN